MNQELFKSVDNYISSLFVGEDEILLQVINSNKEAGLPDISISSNQGKFLNIMVQICKAQRILEIGTLGAYSTIWLARALPNEGKLISLELDEDYAVLAQQNIKLAGLNSKVEIQVGSAVDLLSDMVKYKYEAFDLIFIDADKAQYPAYLELAIQLSRAGTIIIADNVIREGKVLDDNAIDEKVIGVKRFNKMLSENKSLDSTILQMIGVKEYDGMAIAIVKSTA